MKDEILDKMQTQRPPAGLHDFDGLVAVGQWVCAERMGTREARTGGKNPGGVVIPESSQMPIWVAISVGDKVQEQLGNKINIGDRLLFQNPTATLALDGRGFAMVRAAEIIAVLQMPEEQLIVVPQNGTVLQ
jgi:co-chaperonin GroES (HSP10)